MNLVQLAALRAKMRKLSFGRKQADVHGTCEFSLGPSAVSKNSYLIIQSCEGFTEFVSFLQRVFIHNPRAFRESMHM
jgi:hypothetical protein